MNIICHLKENCNSFIKNNANFVINFTALTDYKLSNALISCFCGRYGRAAIPVNRPTSLSYRQCTDLNLLLNLFIIHHRELFKNPELISKYCFSFKLRELAEVMDPDAKVMTVCKRLQRLFIKLQKLNLIAEDKEKGHIHLEFNKTLGELWGSFRSNYIMLNNSLLKNFKNIRSGHGRLCFLKTCELLQKEYCKSSTSFNMSIDSVCSNGISLYTCHQDKLNYSLSMLQKRLTGYLKKVLKEDYQFFYDMRSQCVMTGAIDAYQSKAIKKQFSRKYVKDKNLPFAVPLAATANRAAQSVDFFAEQPNTLAQSPDLFTLKQPPEKTDFDDLL